jgi:hypothetical protein
MKNLLRIATMWFAATAMTAVFASAQTAGVGYAFGSPGFATCCGDSIATLHAGGGGELRIADVFGVGADIGYAAPWRYFSDGAGLLSINGTYYLARRGRGGRMQGFVTSGYSLLFRDGSENLWNIGAGVDCWARPEVGIRVELRDHILSEYGGTVHLWGPRIGVVWRRK